LPTGGAGAELDALVRDGSAAWRALRAQPAIAAAFPDGHLDIATALAAQRADAAAASPPQRCLAPAPNGSFVAFLRPPGCPPGACAALDALLAAGPGLGECLAAAALAAPGGTAVLSLLDHHAALRFDDNGTSCALVDTLGERLFEGNSRAYVVQAGVPELARLLQECVAAPRLRALGAQLAAGGEAATEALCQQLQVDVQLLAADGA
jgi:hypothetical protein